MSGRHPERPPALHIVLPYEGEPRLVVASPDADATARLRDDLQARGPRLGENVARLLDQIPELRSIGGAR